MPQFTQANKVTHVALRNPDRSNRVAVARRLSQVRFRARKLNYFHQCGVPALSFGEGKSPFVCPHPKIFCFNALLHHRAATCFYAFDLIWLKGENLREAPLIERKKMLRKIVPRRGARLLYVDHIEGPGEDLFRLTCERDLEGIVAKWKRGALTDEQLEQLQNGVFPAQRRKGASGQ